MKNVRSKISKIVLSIILTGAVGCSNDNTEVGNLEVESLSFEFSHFKENFPQHFQKIESSKIQYGQSSSIQGKGNEDGATFPIVDGDNVIGRYLGLSDQSTAIYFDFENYEESISVYDVNNPDFQRTYYAEYDAKTNSYIYNDLGNKGWCEVSCTLGAMAIAASDGPAPFMDYLAVAYGIACLADCAQN